MKLPLPYRLALKIGVEATGSNPRSVSYTGYIGWAAISLHSGDAEDIPAGLNPAEVAVVIYAKSDDMLDPMSPEAFDARLAQALRRLPSGVKIIPVPFDAGAYRAWCELEACTDSYENRAKWASQVAFK